jgi:hypothetical protein
MKLPGSFFLGLLTQNSPQKMSVVKKNKTAAQKVSSFVTYTMINNFKETGPTIFLLRITYFIPFNIVI